MRAEQCGEDDAGRGIVVPTDPARADLIQRVGQGRDQQQQHGRVVEPAAWPDHHQRAGKADQHRAPAPPADALVQQRHRQRGDDQRRGEPDRRRGRQRHPPDCHDEHQVARQHQHRAADLHGGPSRPQQCPAILGQEHDQHDDQMPGESRPDDLGDRVMRGQQLHRRVHERKQRCAGAHQCDAAQHIGPAEPRTRAVGLRHEVVCSALATIRPRAYPTSPGGQFGQ